MRPATATGIRGMGDRWLAGEPIDGVEFGFHARVRIATGRYAGRAGSVAFLMNLDADPLYLVDLGAGTGDVRVRGSGLRRA
ncbi:MAG: hypothetical protein ABI601_05710 [bacterium]